MKWGEFKNEVPQSKKCRINILLKKSHLKHTHQALELVRLVQTQRFMKNILFVGEWGRSEDWEDIVLYARASRDTTEATS